MPRKQKHKLDRQSPSLTLEGARLDGSREEIMSLAAILDPELRQEVTTKAVEIAVNFFKVNPISDPVTLARASFYLAMKELGLPADQEIESLTRNNGKTNGWWMYLVPTVQNRSEG